MEESLPIGVWVEIVQNKPGYIGGDEHSRSAHRVGRAHRVPLMRSKRLSRAPGGRFSGFLLDFAGQRKQTRGEDLAY